jgi:hypothetical protein
MRGGGGYVGAGEGGGVGRVEGGGCRYARSRATHGSIRR